MKNGDCATPHLLHEIFERSAALHPDAVAVEVPGSGWGDPSESVTYSELDARADAVATRLAPFIAGECVVAILIPRRTHELYAAQLGVLKAGAAYTCLDPTLPMERASFVLEDASVVALVSAEEWWGGLESLGFSEERAVDVRAEAGLPAPTQRVPAPGDLSYVIYTSGTTGKPKGVMIEHHSIVNLVLSDVDYFDIGPGDRVAQSSSPVYDSSVEEIWLALAVGATLVVMNDEVVRLGPDLVPWLREHRITVFCPPPSLLRMTGCEDPGRELPELRLLYVGGEELPVDTADCWAPACWLENGYGPTECTVTVVRGRVRSGEGITIGRPVANNRALILDEEQQEVAPGKAGELCIGGEGVARGYLKRPELTQAAFIQHPTFGRLYRTGDLVEPGANGELVYLGRMDAQVKIRGHRIELGAVEAELVRCHGVLDAVCTVQKDGSVSQLAAHVVLERGFSLDAATLRQELRTRVSEPMVPALIASIAEVPTSPTSGKVDRKALPRIEAGRGTPAEREHQAPANPAEVLVARAFEERLSLEGDVSVVDDFFLDLGGDSLSAAEVISILRRHPLTSGLTVRDLYEARNVRLLAARVGDAETSTQENGRRKRPPRGLGRHATLVAILQAAWVLVLGLGAAMLGYFLGFVVLPWLMETLGLVPFLLLSPVLGLAAFLLFVPASIAMAVLVKRLLIGRYRAGRHRYLSGYYLRHWMVQHFVRLVPWGFVEGTVFKNACLRALGARIGRRVHLDVGVDVFSGGWDLLQIGDDVCVGRDAALRIVDHEDQHLVLAPVRLAKGATLGTRAIAGPGSSVEEGGHLEELSALSAGRTLPARERWSGVPAERRGDARALPSPDDPTWSPRAHGLLIMGIHMALGFVVGLPGLILSLCACVAFELDSEAVLEWLFDPRSWGATIMGLLLAWVVISALLGLAMQALVLRWSGRLQPGVFSRWGRSFIWLHLKGRVVEAAGNTLSGTLFWPWWLRLAGMKVGRKGEISSIMEVAPELVEVGPESFFADGIYLGSLKVVRGVVQVGHTSFGGNAFLGNHSVIPSGSRLPADILLGICAVADMERIERGTSWFGNPLFRLPRREIVDCDRSLTHDPAWYRIVSRVFWEGLRFFLPVWPFLLLLIWFKWLSAYQATLSLAHLLFIALPLVSLLLAASLCAFVVALKWLLLGRVRPGQHPLWSCWCSRWDFLYVAWAAYARPLVNLEGTPLMAWWLRAMGVQVGRRVYLAGAFAQVVDPDMLRFEDDSTVACMFQAHSFEDRVLKIAPVRIGEGSSVGAGAVLLYGAHLEDGCRVASGSVVMKNEVLLAGRDYAGSPTRELTWEDQFDTVNDAQVAESRSPEGP